MPTPTVPDYSEYYDIMLTPDGGLAKKYTNKTGGITTKGYLVDTHHTIDNAIKYVGVNQPDCIGVIYGDKDGSQVADGTDVWVVFTGVAKVYFIGSTTNGDYARVSRTDGGELGIDGQAISEAVPTSPFSTDKHFQEIGHVLTSRTGAGLADVNLHFN